MNSKEVWYLLPNVGKSWSNWVFEWILKVTALQEFSLHFGSSQIEHTLMMALQDGLCTLVSLFLKVEWVAHHCSFFLLPIWSNMYLLASMCNNCSSWIFWRDESAWSSLANSVFTSASIECYFSYFTLLRCWRCFSKAFSSSLFLVPAALWAVEAIEAILISVEEYFCIIFCRCSSCLLSSFSLLFCNA